MLSRIRSTRGRQSALLTAKRAEGPGCFLSFLRIVGEMNNQERNSKRRPPPPFPGLLLDGPLNPAEVLATRPAARRGAAIFSTQAWTDIGRSLDLTRRELQIVRGIFDDHTEFAIGSELGISSHTVHTHMERLHHKLGVVDRIALVLRITEQFLKLTALPGSLLPPICANHSAGHCPFQGPVSRRRATTQRLSARQPTCPSGPFDS